MQAGWGAGGGCLDTPSLSWRVRWKLGSLLLSGALERQIFFGKGNGVALSTRQTIFLVSSQGGAAGWGEESKKEREIKSTRVKLCSKGRIQNGDETRTLPVLAARGPLSRQPGSHGAWHPRRRQFDPMFHKAFYLRGKGHGFSPSTCGEAEHVTAKKTQKMAVVRILTSLKKVQLAISPSTQ